MSGTVIVYKHVNNEITVNLGFDLSTNTIVSQIRTQPKRDAPLVADWEVEIVDASTGELTLTMTETVSGAIDVEKGYMDILRLVGTEPYPVFDTPLEVSIRDVVTEP
jgi:hypothetical protein